jgi:hypothetical protein
VPIVSVVAGAGDRWQDRGAAAREERRRRHEQAREQEQQPRLGVVHREHEAERDYRAQQVAADHHEATVGPVEQHAGERPDEDGGHRAREHHAAHHEPRSGRVQRQAEHGDVVEVIADLRHHLAEPRVPVVAVGAEQGEEVGHGAGWMEDWVGVGRQYWSLVLVLVQVPRRAGAAPPLGARLESTNTTTNH